jgi:hypothetical protein
MHRRTCIFGGDECWAQRPEAVCGAMSCGAEKSGPPHWEAAKPTSKLRTTKDSTSSAPKPTTFRWHTVGMAGEREEEGGGEEDPAFELKEENVRLWEPLEPGKDRFVLCIYDDPDKRERAMLTVDTELGYFLYEANMPLSSPLDAADELSTPEKRVKASPYLSTMWSAWSALSLPPSDVPRSVLCLGLGAGILPSALAATAAVEVVEAFPSVLDAARRYFGYEGKAVADGGGVHLVRAEDFIATSFAEARKYDAVFVDIGDASEEDNGVVAPATCLRDMGRMRKLRHMVRAGGLLVCNCLWEGGDVEDRRLFESILEDMQFDGDVVEWVPVSSKDLGSPRLVQAICSVRAAPPV